MQPVDEAVDLLGNRVQVEARAIRRRDAEPPHERLRAVVAAANRDAFRVEDLRDVVRMDPVEVERHDPGAAVGRRSVGNESRDLREPFQRVSRKRMLMLLDRFEPDRAEVVERRAEADGLRDRLRSRLELVRQLSPRRLLDFHLPDHVSAEIERLHLLEERRAAPQRSDAARAAELV